MRHGFTLIELLIVIGILSVLMAVLMPMYGIIRNMMKRSTTEYVLKRADTALRLFKTDWGVFPCQTSYPEPFTGTGFPNRLYYLLGEDIDPAQAALVRADMQSASLQYAESHGGASLLYVDADLAASIPKKNKIPLNRAAREQVRLAVLSGNLRLRGPIITYVNSSGTMTVVADRSGTLALASPTSDVGPGPGWAADYLHGELGAAHRSGQAIIDAWGNPLVYICQAVPAVTTSNSLNSGASSNDYSPRNYDFGLGARGFEVDSSSAGLVQTLKATQRHRLAYMGRIRLDAVNAGDGLPVPTSTTDVDLPYTGKLMQSDMRHFCLRGFETEFELWSSGRDASFSYTRDASVNADNISIVPYNKERP